MSCCSATTDATVRVADSRRITPELVCLIVAGFIAGNTTLAALVANLSETGEVRVYFQTGLLVATLLVAALLAPQLFRSVIANVRRRRLSVDVLFLLGCTGAMAFSMISFVGGTGPVYFEVVAILLFVYCLGSWIKGETQRRIWTSLDAWSPEKHQCQVVGSDGLLRWQAVNQVRPGDRVLVPAGTMVPVDGKVVGGTAFLQTSTMTGEPHIRPVREGQPVLASAVVVDAPLQIQATEAGDSRLIDRITQQVDAAAKAPSRWETQADRVAAWFTPIVASLATLTWLAWWWLAGFDQGILTGLAVLLVACPCAFGFATPVSIWVTLSRLASCSLLVQRNDVIERLAVVDTVVFDKTGTLTRIEPCLLDLQLAADCRWTAGDILTLARSLEASSHHPIAAAFLGESSGELEARGVQLPGGVEIQGLPLLPVSQLELLPARGVSGSVEYQGRIIRVTIGRFESASIGHDVHWRLMVDQARQRGRNLIAIELDGSLVAVASVGERPIDTLDAGLTRLKQLGLGLKLFSGDAGARVERLSIEDASGGMTPADKADQVQQLVDSGKRVLFVGDGSNDAAAMTLATASIGIASGSALAAEAADMMWHGQDLVQVADSIEICRRSTRRLKRSLIFAISYNSLGMLLAITGLLHPVAAVVLMMGSSLTVVLHAADMQWQSQTKSVPLQASPEPEPQRDLVQLG